MFPHNPENTENKVSPKIKSVLEKKKFHHKRDFRNKKTKRISKILKKPYLSGNALGNQ